MPSSTKELRDKFFKRDEEDEIISDGITEAEETLKKYGVKFINGLMTWEGQLPDVQEVHDALDWLIDEWDYAIE